MDLPRRQRDVPDHQSPVLLHPVCQHTHRLSSGDSEGVPRRDHHHERSGAATVRRQDSALAHGSLLHSVQPTVCTNDDSPQLGERRQISPLPLTSAPAVPDDCGELQPE